MITIRHATQIDSDNLIRLTGLTPMRGQISIRIDRKPDFFLLLKERGEAIVLVAEDQKDHIIGCFTATLNTFFFQQKEESIYYLGDLKIHPGYSGSRVAYLLVKKMHEELNNKQAGWIFGMSAGGNEAVVPFFIGKAGLPPFENIGHFNVYQLLPKKRRRLWLNDYSIELSKQLNRFYNDCFKQYFFSPTIHFSQNLQHLVKIKDNQIIAALSLYDTSLFKQNVVIDYPLWIGFTLRILKALKYFLPISPIPEKYQPLKILSVKYYGIAEGQEQEFAMILEEARAKAYELNYHFLSIGTDVNDKRISGILKNIRSFVFKSDAWICNLKPENNQTFKPSKGIAFEDFSIV